MGGGLISSSNSARAPLSPSSCSGHVLGLHKHEAEIGSSKEQTKSSTENTDM
jgi:hypothetical protein